LPARSKNNFLNEEEFDVIRALFCFYLTQIHLNGKIMEELFTKKCKKKKGSDPRLLPFLKVSA